MQRCILFNCKNTFLRANLGWFIKEDSTQALTLTQKCKGNGVSQKAKPQKGQGCRGTWRAGVIERYRRAKADAVV